MPEVTFTITGLKEATEQVRSATIAGAQNGLKAAAVRGAELVQKLIGQPYEGHNARINRGLMQQSIAFELATQTALIGKAVVFSQPPPGGTYTGVMEFGRRPGSRFPPLKAIMLWLDSPKMESFVQQFISEGRPTEKNRGADYVARRKRELAFLVGRKIASRGIAPHLMFTRAAEDLQKEFPAIVRGAIAQEIEKRGLGPGAEA